MFASQIRKRWVRQFSHHRNRCWQPDDGPCQSKRTWLKSEAGRVGLGDAQTSQIRQSVLTW